MLLEAGTGRLAQVSDDVLPRLADQMGERVCSETHRGVVELVTSPHETVRGVVGELARTRTELQTALADDGFAVAAAGTHPTTTWEETDVSLSVRHQLVLATMAGLARREPTFALHVHVAVPDPDDAVRLMARLRWHLPLLLALSANSPFWQGRDTGMASTRTSLFGAFPRTGLPPRFTGYSEWVATLDPSSAATSAGQDPKSALEQVFCASEHMFGVYLGDGGPSGPSLGAAGGVIGRPRSR